MAVDKKNIFLSQTAEPLSYSSVSRPIDSNYPHRTTTSHANFIQRKLRECYAESLTQRQVAAIRYKEGVYLEFSGASQHDLAVKSLENRTQGIRLLNVHEDTETNTVKATVYIPAGKENYFIQKVEAYASEQTKSGKPKNNDLVSSIENVKLAMLESFWVGKPDTIPTDDPIWCELWLRYDYQTTNPESWRVTEENITLICQENNIPIDEKRIIFPERIVKLIRANAHTLKNLISMCPFITEIRCAPEATTFFDELSNSEQTEWVDELLSRTTYENDDVSVCLLDTGITSGHSLLAPATNINHIQSVNTTWGNGDHQGHGTEMAGIALFYDLKKALESRKPISVSHEIESVKILPPTGGNLPELYGAITEQAVSLAEISNPKSKRVICMAVTAPDHNTFDGSPTSWSAALDSITSGADEENEKRLFLISAGNVYPDEFVRSPYPDANTLHCVESPGQSWNAITIGAYTNDVTISNPDFSGYVDKYTKPPTTYDIPPSALEDETFAALITEAEKYIGYPYVWGGSNPNTSFDCSGFVSWVLTQSGVCNTGRLGAQGLYNISTPVSSANARPGDLIFFVGTYDTPGVSHVGIYVGGGKMLHCGDPIQYADINTSYWQSHFYAFGRPPYN